MSIQYMDNFSIYGTNTANVVAGTPWNAVGGSSSLQDDPDGVSGGKVLRVRAGVSTPASLVLPTATDVTYIAFRWWCSSLPTSNSEGQDVELRDGSNSIRYVLRVTATGALVLTRTDGAGSTVDSGDISGFTDVATSANVISSGAWYHIEWFMNRTTGAYEVRVEGITVLSGTDGSPATGDTGIVSWRDEWVSSASNGFSIFIKDLVIADDNGSVNNSFIGTVQVVTLSVNSDVSSGWTKSTGTSDYELLDETTPNDADYIEAEDDPLPAASIMGLQDLPPDIVGVRALQTMVRGRKTDGGDATVVVSLLSSAAEDSGATHSLTTSFQYEWDISELDPNTAAVWNPVAVDAATIKINRTL